MHRSKLKIWISYWKREGSAGMDMWNAPTVQSRQPLTYRLMGSVGLGDPRWLGSSWQRGIAESGSSQLSTLMTQTPGDLVWDLPCVQKASCLEGGPLLWIRPLYLHINQKSDDDDDFIKKNMKPSHPNSINSFHCCILLMTTYKANQLWMWCKIVYKCVGGSGGGGGGGAESEGEEDWKSIPMLLCILNKIICNLSALLSVLIFRVITGEILW